jgi:polysaccharide biosynthesis/export protein
MEVLSMAGGIDADAGANIRINRYLNSKSEPPDPAFHDSGDFQAAEISVERLLEARRPEYNVVVQPQDVIVVQRARLVYVIGEVRRSGGFVLREREAMSVLQALSLAEGLTITASAGHARILRPGEDGARAEIAVDVKGILAGKGGDVSMLPNDVLFIPKSTGRSASLRAVEAAISMGTGLVIWRR